MSFPARVLRAVFGPDFINTRPVEHPQTEFDANAMQVLLWQVSGTNQSAVRATVAAKWTGSAFQIFHQGEAWNPEGSQTPPLLERASTGVYTWTFASTYPDVEGNDVSPNIGPVRVSSHKVLTAFADRIEAHAWRDAADASIIHVRLWDASGTPVDEPFWLEAL